MQHEHTPETLLDLLRMGTELETAESQIQKALRTCVLIRLVSALRKEAKMLVSSTLASSSGVEEGFSKVEQILGMHKILPDHPVVEIDTEDSSNFSFHSEERHHHPSIHRQVRHQRLRHTVEQWRYLPEEDSVALDLHSLVLRGMLDGKLSERLQAMLSASHLVRLLRKLDLEIMSEKVVNVSVPQAATPTTEAAAAAAGKQRLRDIQIRLEDDICFFFEQLDNDRTVPSFRVALSMRVCAESMRQLWPHLSDNTDDEDVDVTRATKTTHDGTTTTSVEEVLVPTRTSGPLVELFVFKSIRPLASFVELFTPALEQNQKVGKSRESKESKDYERKKHTKGEEGGEGESITNNQQNNRNLELLTNLLERARSIVHTRLATLRASLGKIMASKHSSLLPSIRLGTNRSTEGSTERSTVGFSGIAFSGTVPSRTASSSIALDISETHQRFIYALLQDMYFNKDWGIDSAIQRAFVTANITAPAATTGTTGTTATGRFAPEDVVRMHELAWSLVGGMAAANEVEAAIYAGNATDKLFEPIFTQYLRMEQEDLKKVAMSALNSWNDEKSLHTIIKNAMNDRLCRYEVMLVHEIHAMGLLFDVQRWKNHMDRISMCWTEFVNIVETLTTLRVREHLTNLTTSTDSHQFRLSLPSNNYEKDKEELAERLEKNVQITLVIMRHLAATAHDVVIPTLTRLDKTLRTNVGTIARNRSSSSSTNEQMFIQCTKDYIVVVGKCFNARVAPLQGDVSTALSEGWLKSATIGLAKFHLSKQSNDDFLFCSQEDPTTTCIKVCALFKKRRKALSTLVTGQNLVQMESALHRELLSAVWSHILTLKFDTNGAQRLMVDIERYRLVCQLSILEDQHSYQRQGNRSFDLLQKMAELLAISANQIDALFPEIVSATSISQDEIIEFVQRRHDWPKWKDAITLVIRQVFDVTGVFET